MRDLSTANDLISRVAKDYPAISPLAPEDYPLFQKFFAKEPHTYGNSWTYITQGMYGIGPNKIGYKYFDGTNLSAVCVYPKIENPDTLVLYWIRPMGPTVIQIISTISKTLLKDFKLPTYIKKLFKNQHDQLIQAGFKEVTTFPWHTLYPAEDDTYPEQILKLANTLSVAETINNRKRINRALRYYERYKNDQLMASDNVEKHVEEAKSFLNDFFAYNNGHAKMPIISDASDYSAMVTGLSTHDTTQNKFIYYNKQAIGFYFLERQDTHYASLYALLSLREQANHVVDFMMFDMITALENQGIDYLNMGGSENANLNYFKKKFRPIRENQMYWVCLH